jgi:hypothetical protein
MEEMKMADSVKISHSDLRRVVNILLDHLEKTAPQPITFPFDYYWETTPESRYDRYEKPHDFLLGQLSEDWSWLEAVRGGQAPINFHFVYLANILRAIGEAVKDV